MADCEETVHGINKIRFSQTGFIPQCLP